MVALKDWNPEDEHFWSIKGEKIAVRNLFISIPCLLCAFAIWLFWSIITVQMQNLGFPFEKEQLYTLTAIAGLIGATLRIPNSFFIALAGGRNVIAVTTFLLIIPALGTGIALQSRDTPFTTFAILAALSGFGGGVFASSMSNISFFFPKRVQGLYLGLNAGLGNAGVSVMQVLLPFTMSFALFGTIGGSGIQLPEKLGGSTVWIQNCGLTWVPFLFFLGIAAWVGMNNLPQHKIASTVAAIFKMLWLLVLGLSTGGIGLFLLLWMKWSMWVVLPIIIALTVVVMRYISPASVRKNLSGQFSIFKEKHNWILAWLYTMTFGSFIGYSAAFPKLIQDVFGYLPDGTINSSAPNPLHYAWLGPLVGSLIRPVGGWLSDRLGGAKVTQWNTVVMIASALGVSFVIKLAGASNAPHEYFVPFLLLFLLLFLATGVGNGSIFRMIPIIFKPHMAGPVLGWTSAIAAYGAFIVPKVFGGQIKLGTPEYALYGFVVYYVSCLFVNWWFYARENAEIPC